MTDVIGSRIVWHEQLESTNDTARVHASRGDAEGMVVCANAQTAGRGRFQRVWASEPGQNLTLSVLLRPPFPEERMGLVNFMASLAVARAVMTYPGVTPSLRWPNDVYLNGSKICGILSERTGNALIVGIGLNVNQQLFPASLSRATSLARETGAEIDRGTMLRVLLHELDGQYARAQREGFDGIMNDWRALCEMPGTRVQVMLADIPTEGDFENVDDDGALVLRCAGGNRRFFAGDATLQRRA